MATSLPEPPTSSSPHATLQLAHAAPAFIESQSPSRLPYPLSALFPSRAESQEKWVATETLFLACLRAGDDASAYALLESLTDRFGPGNARVSALRGLWAEATAATPPALDHVLRNYDDVLQEDASHFAIRKRRVALLRSMGRTPEALQALTHLLDSSPTDAEAWSELADLYAQLGWHDQAVFCLEEVVLLVPNAWNVQARLGEVLYAAAAAARQEGTEAVKALSESVRRFCRSVELCDGYLRGYYGLKVSTTRLLDVLGASPKSPPVATDPLTGDLPPPTMKTARKLNELATAKLAEIVRRVAAGEKGADGYDDAEVAAARELLAREAQRIDR